MALSVGVMMRSLDTHNYQHEWRQDGKLYAIKDPVFGWEQVPSDADAFLSWLGYAYADETPS